MYDFRMIFDDLASHAILRLESVYLRQLKSANAHLTAQVGFLLGFP